MGWDQYAGAWAARHGGYDLRRAPLLARGWLRVGYGCARVLSALRVRPGSLTLAGVGLAAAVPLVAGRGVTGLWVAAGLGMLSALAATVARGIGVLARSDPAPRTTVREAVADRLGEVAWLAGFWVAGVPGPLVAVCGVATGLHEYVQEQALAVGASRVAVQATGGRTAREGLAVAGLALAGLAGTVGPPAVSVGALVVATSVWLLLVATGLGQLTGTVRRL